MTIISTHNLALRVITRADWKMVLQLFNEPLVLKYIGDKSIKTKENALAYIENGPINMQFSQGFSLYCCELKHSGELIGLSGLIKRDGVDFPEVGFAFLEKFCGQGYGYESSFAVIEYAKAALKLPTLNAICDTDNIVSNKLLLKLGFQLKGLKQLPEIQEPVNLYHMNLI